MTLLPNPFSKNQISTSCIYYFYYFGKNLNSRNLTTALEKPNLWSSAVQNERKPNGKSDKTLRQHRLSSSRVKPIMINLFFQLHEGLDGSFGNTSERYTLAGPDLKNSVFYLAKIEDGSEPCHHYSLETWCCDFIKPFCMKDQSPLMYPQNLTHDCKDLLVLNIQILFDFSRKPFHILALILVT